MSEQLHAAPAPRGAGSARTAARARDLAGPVSSATRVIVGFPFSTIHVTGADESVAVAELLGRLCHGLADGDGTEQLAAIARDVDALVARSRQR